MGRDVVGGVKVEIRELTLMIGTEQPAVLARFYGEVLGLERLSQYRDPVFRTAGANIRILKHSGISGRTREGARLQINLLVADVRREWERIAAQGVQIVRTPEVERWGGMVATMEDPDGNYVQIIQERA